MRQPPKTPASVVISKFRTDNTVNTVELKSASDRGRDRIKGSGRKNHFRTRISGCTNGTHNHWVTSASETFFRICHTVLVQKVTLQTL